MALTLMGTIAVRGQYVSTPISTGLLGPNSVTTDPNGTVYLTDSANNRVVKYVPSSGTVTTLAGQDGPNLQGTNNGVGAAAQFSNPLGIVYARGGLVVVDSGNQTLRFVTLGGAVSNLAGITGSYGFADGSAATAQFTFPSGIAADPAGNLYIADQGNSAIRMLSVNNSVSTISGGSYQFNSPAAVAVDNNTNIWVADTKNDVICMVSNKTVYVIAGTPHVSGSSDGVTAAGSLFNHPAGLLWVPENGSLLISDSGNDTIRSLFLTNVNGSQTYVVQTISGIAGQPGLVNGLPSVAQFDAPMGLAVDVADTGYYVVDSGTNALRILQPTQPLPQIVAPKIGYVTFPIVAGSPSATFNDITGSSVVFNNAVDIAVEADPTAALYVTYGLTPANPLDNPIPTPGPATGFSPGVYTSDDNGLPPNEVPPSVISPAPDITLYAVSEASGRPTSPVSSARIQFITANPIIGGNNAASILLTDGTTNAQMWYTLDGSTPAVNGTNSFGPVTSGQILTLNISTNTRLSVEAFAANFEASGVSSAVFSPTNFQADQLTFGFQSGEASSEFIGAAGQRFYAPVTLSLIPTAETMYTLQFDLVVTNGPGSPPVGQTYNFQTMLEQPLPSSPGIYIPIPPAMVGASSNLVSLLLNNPSINLLEVGWVERPPETNLYPTPSQTLITYSQAHDTLFLNTGQKVIVGGYSFVIPPNAVNGQTYQINTGNGSATSDGITTPVFIQTVTNGALGQGAINSQKIVTVGSAQYLVGDAAPFRWFNAGDFGDTNLENNDVTEVFQSAIYHLNAPPPGSDYFDAMDSSDGIDNNYYNGNDSAINLITMGDGILAVDDVYVTYRRSLDYSLAWYARYWSNGIRNAVAVPNTLSPLSYKSAPAPVKMATSGPRYVTVAADQVQTTGSSTIQVPIRVLAADTMPIRVLMFNVEIDPLDGSPAIIAPVSFSAASGLATSNTLTSTLGVNMYAQAWLDSTVAGVSGTNLIGTLNITLPPSATTNSSYLVHFDHFSCSPNGVSLFHATVKDGLITLGNRTGSSWKDGISDAWRLLNFGTVSNALSAANADPDGDGASNWQEYIAGTNPQDSTSVFQFQPAVAPTGSGFVLQWPSIVNKHYSVQCSPVAGGPWTTVATNLLGNGQPMQWTDTNAGSTAKFYRASVQ
jgi:sugar lactone lactonase YvrE